MYTIFKSRDRAIETTCYNLILAKLLMPKEVAAYMAHLGQLDDNNLAEQLIGSKLLYDEYLETCWILN